MYLFAHVLSGILLGTVFFYLLQDRRVFPVCIAGALLPDLIDKPLAVLFPELFGASRTLAHAFLFFLGILLVALVLWHYRQNLLGVAFACSVLLHQVLDSTWNIPAIWLFPLLGPFPVIIVPDYVRHSLWMELSSPSELAFALASCLLLAAWYPEWIAGYMPRLTARHLTVLRMVAAAILGTFGFIFLVYGLQNASGSFLAPEYAPLTSTMAGILALLGATALAVLCLSRSPKSIPR
ncbi:MAG: metal-dependent hydrolase [Methanomicrobiales archaeon]|nr:metal-dependent hydrolase [Methanomicrobiales archaeon]